jgi:broad specificity phosphatase PhoE
MSARLTLISHAPSQAQRRSAFPLDEPLDDADLAKISNLNWQAPRTQQILTAPEQRTQQTAQALNLSATQSTDLRDCDYGTWRGRDLTELHLEKPEDIATWLTDPTATPHNGESITDLLARTATWLNTLPNSGHTIAVTHPAIIRSAIVHILNAPPQSFWRIDIAPLTVTDLRHNGQTWTLRSTAVPLSKSNEEAHPEKAS